MSLSRTVRTLSRPDAGRHSSLLKSTRHGARWLSLLLLLGAITVGLRLVIGLPGQASSQPPPSAGLRALLQTAGPLIVYSEFGEESDTLWAADPDNPAERTGIARVRHARGYGISPSLSPDGARIAYTVLPAQTAQPDAAPSAELWVLDTKTGDAARLAEGVDLVSTPVWSAEADALVVRRSGAGELLRIDLSGEASAIASLDAGLYAIGFSPDGASLYYAALSPSGTDLFRAAAAASSAPERVAHLSDGVARDWHLSPDGTRLAYLAQDAEVGFVAQVLDLATGRTEAPLAVAGAAQFNPVWETSGALTVGSLGTGGAPLRLSVDGGPQAASARLPAPPGGAPGFDVPLAWSPDGAHLAVRRFQGPSTSDPGQSRVEVLGADGERRAVSTLSDVIVLGWLEGPL